LLHFCVKIVLYGKKTGSIRLGDETAAPRGFQKAKEINNKFNRVDILVENKKGDLVIFELQNTREADYFQRMLYGTAKVILRRHKRTDNIHLGYKLQLFL